MFIATTTKKAASLLVRGVRGMLFAANLLEENIVPQKILVKMVQFGSF